MICVCNRNKEKSEIRQDLATIFGKINELMLTSMAELEEKRMKLEAELEKKRMDHEAELEEKRRQHEARMEEKRQAAEFQFEERMHRMMSGLMQQAINFSMNPTTPPHTLPSFSATPPHHRPVPHPPSTPTNYHSQSFIDQRYTCI